MRGENRIVGERYGDRTGKDGDSPLVGVEETLSPRVRQRECHELSGDAGRYKRVECIWWACVGDGEVGSCLWGSLWLIAGSTPIRTLEQSQIIPL